MSELHAFPDTGFVRLPQVLAVFPVSRSVWWAGVKSGRFPAAIKLGTRTTAWRAEDIRALIEKLSADVGRVENKTKSAERARPA